ncbi:MAG: 4Fe-4S binding protein [Solobacterium sp.]|nr:4Fe-4S binding protein [Solobacterium sp.]
MKPNEYIRLEPSHCHNCLRCVRACPTNAMTYLKNQPTIVEEECILCGRCYSVCPHDAKAVISDLDRIKEWLNNKEEVIISAAPSFVAVWPQFSSLVKILESRGFSAVRETAEGAKLVTKAFRNLIDEGTMENIITTCCPAVNSLIEKEYGELTPFMAPVVSPMIAHGRLIKQEHPNAKVVFLSPCIAKFKEIRDERFAGSIDACIGMDELLMWISGTLKEEEEKDWDEFEGSIARLYPTPGGILNCIEHDNRNYKYIDVEGIDRIQKVLEAMKEGTLKGYFVEMSACIGSCIGGPLLSHFKHNEWLGQSVIRENVDMNAKITGGELPFDLSAQWKPEDIWRPKHTEEEIQAEMIRLGKVSQDKIHDCGACGYETCRLKAIAVLDGKADPRICLPEALERAESLSNVVIENTPNGIIVFDKDLNVREMNPSARKMLNLDMINPTGMPIGAVLPDDALERLVRMTGRKTEYIRVYYENYKKLLDHAIVNVESQDLYVVILMDRTDESIREEKLRRMRERTIDVTSEVIDEQMRTVQEIASLLGETTAKSKVALTKLKRAMDEDENA